MAKRREQRKHSRVEHPGARRNRFGLNCSATIGLKDMRSALRAVCGHLR
jgi:hypothetical protein